MGIDTQIHTISKPAHSNAEIGAVFNSDVQRMFSLYLWRLDQRAVPEIPAGFDPSGQRTTAEYFFYTPPKSVSIEEPFATRVVATQNGGKFVESHGSIFKNIRIQGTTGFRPRANLPTNDSAVSSIVSAPVDAALDLAASATRVANVVRGKPTKNSIPASEITGFDDSIFLKNMFRLYSDLRATGAPVLMVWRDLKDDDEWIVEPRSIRTEKSSQSPLTYTYMMDLNGLSKTSLASVNPLGVVDPLTLDQKVNNIFTSLHAFKNQLLKSFMVVSTEIKRVTGLVTTSIDLILGSVVNALQGVTAIFSAARNVWPSIRRTLQTSLDNITTSYDQLASVVTAGDPLARELQRTSVALRGAILLLKENSASSYQSRASNTSSAYRDEDIFGSNHLTRRVPGNVPGSGARPDTVEEGRLLSGETIRGAAERLTGDSSTWHDLVILNDLTAPYTSDSADPGDGVLGPGDPILFPSSGRSSSTVDASTSDSTDERGLLPDSLAARVYGRDLRLKSVTLGAGVNVSDIAINQQGDLSSIVGVDNVNQAVLIKFSTEQGELPGYPAFGAQAAIGSKLTISSFNTFRNNTIDTLLSDPRISEAKNLVFTSKQDVLGISATLVLSNTSDYLSTNFALRRL